MVRGGGILFFHIFQKQTSIIFLEYNNKKKHRGPLCSLDEFDGSAIM